MEPNLKPATAPLDPKQEFDPGMPTQVAMEALEGYLLSTPKVDNVLINLGTLVRNRTRKDVLSDQIRTEAMQDAVNLARSVSQSMGLPGSVLIFYLADYHATAPKQLIREPTESRASYYAALGAMRHDLIHNPQPPLQLNQINIRWEYLRPSGLSFQQLASMVRHQKNTHAVAMVSNVPTDYHLVEHVPFFALVRSFTGELCFKEQLGQVVFGHEAMPFNLYTHAVLGDKETFAGTLSIPERRHMYEAAEQEKWLYRTPAFVRDRMRQLGFFTNGITYPLLGRI